MKVIKSLLFYPLLWLRGLFLRIGNIVSGMCLVVFLILVVLKLATPVNTFEWYKVVGFAVAGVGMTMLTAMYDHILLKLNPTDDELTLYR